MTAITMSAGSRNMYAVRAFWLRRQSERRGGGAVAAIAVIGLPRAFSSPAPCTMSGLRRDAGDPASLRPSTRRLLNPVRLVHRCARVGDSLGRVGALVDDGNEGVPEVVPVGGE